MVPVKFPALSKVTRCYKGGGVVGVEPKIRINTEHFKFAHPAARKVKNRICRERRIKSVVSNTKDEPFHRYKSYGLGFPMFVNSTLR
jgi:hypothetical protein